MRLTPGSDAFVAHLREALGTGPVGVAVSGGSDSMALLHLSVDAGIPVRAVTLDHGLRPEAAQEAAMVAGACAGLGVHHDTLVWGRAAEGAGNLADRARRARLRLIAEWARQRGIGAVALGHTADDQAETVLMGLARRAGVDGLSGMATLRTAEGMVWLRPLLGVTRDELRAWLGARGIAWADDPTNEDAAYTRVRARRALARLGPLGIDAAGLAEVAAHLRMARQALDVQTHDAARRIAALDAGDAIVRRAEFAALPDEIRRRLLSHCLCWIASAEYGPRAAPLANAVAAAATGQAAVLHGCRILPAKNHFRVTREARAVARTEGPVEALWDGRWALSGPDSNGLTVRALGQAGLRSCPDWRATGRPSAALAGTPAVWRGTDLVAAPLAGLAKGWHASLATDADTFFTRLLSH